MSTSTRLTTKGQVVIPKSVRQRLRWRPGIPLGVETTPEGAVILRPLASRDSGSFEETLDKAYGLLMKGDPVADLEAEHRSEIAADERRRS